jgi:hypothetical protein
MKGNDELTVAEITQSPIDPSQWYEADVNYELVKALEDRNREVVVKWDVT